jgi:hypothetical protein
VFIGGGRDRSWRGSTQGLQYRAGQDRWEAAGAAWGDGVTFASLAALQAHVYLFGNSLPPLRSVPCVGVPWTPLPTEGFQTGLRFASVEAVGGHICVVAGRSLPNAVRARHASCLARLLCCTAAWPWL